MNTRRTAKAAQAIREAVSTAILFEVRDPRVKNVTVISVEVATDMRSAKVYVSVMGDIKEQALSIHGLNSARGFLQSKVADRLQTKYTPILKFVLDPGIKQSVEASILIRDALDEDSTLEPDDGGDPVAVSDELMSQEQIALQTDGEFATGDSGTEADIEEDTTVSE